jgi:hypothetical protein
MGLSEELVSSMYNKKANTDVLVENSQSQTTVPDGESEIRRNSSLGWLQQCIRSFSASQNCKKIFRTAISEDDLNFVHGMRFLRKS